MDALVKMSQTLLNCGLPHIFINPSNLMIDEDGIIKLIDDLALEKSCSTSPEYTLALSPAQLLNRRGNVQRMSRSKNIAWAIGLTALSAAACCDLAKFYDFSRMTVKQEVIQKKLAKLRKIFRPFSEQLIETIGRCLELDENRRMDLEDLYTFLLPYSNQNQAHGGGSVTNDYENHVYQ